MPGVLSRKALNRALLARQMLLAREDLPALAAIERLAGLQAQAPRPPFVGLWTRLARFERDELRVLLEGRQIVRATGMRGTLHLFSREDYRAFRPVLQPVLSAGMRGHSARARRRLRTGGPPRAGARAVPGRAAHLHPGPRCHARSLSPGR